jgi:hypothetical protein
MRKVILSAVLLAASVAQAQTTTYTAADVAKHATATDCWMIMNTNKVYNFTAFLTIHPAGAAIIVPYCGKNGDPGFASVSHSSHATALEATYLIGSLVAAPASISVSIAPTTAAVNIGGSAQFAPKVLGSTAGVSLTVYPPTLGTISASGLFTGLAAGQGTVTAASTQDPTKSASAVVTVNSTTTPPPVNTIAVSITPSALSLNVGTQTHFKATLTNSTQGVVWSASPSAGTIDKVTGVLSAALVAGSGTVTATSLADPTKSATAEVTLTAVTCAPGGGNDGGDNGGHHHHDD